MDSVTVAKVCLVSSVSRLLHGWIEEEAKFQFVPGWAAIDNLLPLSLRDGKLPLAEKPENAAELIERTANLVQHGWRQSESSDKIFRVPGYQCRARLTGRYTSGDDRSGKDTRNTIMVIYSGEKKLAYKPERDLLAESLAETKAFMKKYCGDDLALEFTRECDMTKKRKDADDFFEEFLPLRPRTNVVTEQSRSADI